MLNDRLKRMHLIFASEGYDMDYKEWKECMEKDGYFEEMAEINGCRESEFRNRSHYHDWYSGWLGDECCNLDVEVDGIIVGFAVLGLWDGQHNGFSMFGKNVKNILHTQCDDYAWYCDRYNAYGIMSHHDGENKVLYRVCNDKEQAKRLGQKWMDGDITLKQAMKATKSLFSYIGNVYGWKLRKRIP